MNTSALCILLTVISALARGKGGSWGYPAFFAAIATVALTCDADMDVFDLPARLAGGVP